MFMYNSHYYFKPSKYRVIYFIVNTFVYFFKTAIERKETELRRQKKNDF